MNSLDKILIENNRPYKELEWMNKSNLYMSNLAYVVDKVFSQTLKSTRYISNLEKIELALDIILNPKYKQYNMDLYTHSIATIKPFPKEKIKEVALSIYDANFNKSLDQAKLIVGVFNYLYDNYGLQYVNHYKSYEEPYKFGDNEKLWNIYYEERLNKSYCLNYHNKLYYLIASNRQFKELCDNLDNLHTKYAINEIKFNQHIRSGDTFISKSNLDKFIYFLKGQVDYSNQIKNKKNLTSKLTK